MNNFISDWNFEGDLPATGQKNPTGADHDLVELLWRNGQVVLHSQTHRKQAPNILNEPTRQSHNKSHDNQATRPCGTYGNYPINNMAQDDETVSWIHFPIEDSFEKEFCSNFFSELPSCDPIDVDRPFEGDKLSKPGASDAATAAPTRRLKPPCPESQMPPPRGSLGRVVSLPPPPSGHDKCDYRPSGQGEAGECSLMTVGLSHCGSNQLANDLDVSWVSSNNGDGSNTGLSAPPPSFKCEGAREKNVRRMPQSESGKTETLEPTVTSSSGGSGSSFGRACKQSTATTTSGNTTNNKRKAREAEELECQSEAAELESAAANKSAQRSGTSRKSRAAEVHNQSERRRRDRINEKMKALQELIPHSNKTDKASMLDEAIEYLKSLQLQLQVMWMGSGMTPMMFPGVQHYMSRMSMAMGPPALPSMHMAPPQHRVPVVDHQAAAAPMIVGPTGDHQAFNPLNYQNHHQMQGASFPDQYARFMGFHPMQTHVSQPVNIFRYSPQTVQQGQSIAQQGIITTGPSTAGGAPIDGTALSGKMG